MDASNNGGSSLNSMFSFAMHHFDWPFTKNYNILNAPQIEFFTINIIFYKRLSFRPTIYKTSAHFWTKDTSQIVMLLWSMLCAHSWMNAYCLFHCLMKAFIHNLVHHRFWLRLYKTLNTQCLLWFILIN
jgi:hypothetical protein